MPCIYGARAIDNVGKKKHIVKSLNRQQFQEYMSKNELDELKRFNGDRGFGTTIVLQYFGDPSDFLETEIDLEEYIFGDICDPTYPVKDGDVTHLIDICTCSWIYIKEGQKIPYEIECLTLHV